MSIIISSFL